MTILFSCAGRRNYLLRYFKEVVGKTGTIIAVDSDPTASAFSDADIALQVPSVTDSEYLSTLETIVSEYDVDMLIPLNDWELFTISSHREQFENFRKSIPAHFLPQSRPFPIRTVSLCTKLNISMDIFRKPSLLVEIIVIHFFKDESNLGVGVRCTGKTKGR